MLHIAAVFAVYVLSGKLGLAFASLHASATPVWPPAGIALAALLLFGTRMWPAVFVGAFVVNVTTAGSVLTSLGIAGGNTLEALVGAHLVRRFASGATSFERAQDIFKLAALAALGSTAVSATIGVGSLVLTGYAASRDAGWIWLTWWLGDASGILLLTPLIVLWGRPSSDRPLRRRPLEVIALFTVVVVSALLVFGGVLPETWRRLPTAFVSIPPLLWAAYRFGPRMTSTALGALFAVALPGTLGGAGPFSPYSPSVSLPLVQAFLAMMALTALPFAAVVAERRRAEDAARVREEQLRVAVAAEGAARAEAEAANRSKDEFLAMLSHELRNPLGAIGSAIQVLDRVADPAVAARARLVIARQTQHLSRLVEDLLDVSRAMTGKIAVRTEVVDLGAVAERAVAGLVGRHPARAGDIALDARSVHVVGDGVRLEQVVNNLVENALKYTPSGGRVGVTVHEEDGAAVLAVDDSGVGIAADLLPHVFDLFVQADRSLERTAGGLGIGLTLVRQIVELHGGTVQAASAGVGCGSRFTVRLPATTIAPRAPGALPARSDRRNRILVVEDNDDAREMLRELATLLGHEVHEAVDGAGGVDAALRLLPDLTLVDIGLPGIDGYEVARRIRSEPRGRSLRLVALTGYGRSEDRERALAGGYDEHLVKPVDPARLAALLRDPSCGGARPVKSSADGAAP
jgi:signal transduction histidine kinase/ActR/RegA family two-component response regulator